jgi:deazaflavin-dependent oxidoreductase (nitroreductase family)
VSEPTLLARLRTRRWFRPAAHAPLLAYRLGLAPVVGRAFMVLTTTGRRSGAPRHTMVIFRELEGRKYIAAAYGDRSHWYRNMLADPRVTVQTARGTEAMAARPITDEGTRRRVITALRDVPFLPRLLAASQGLAGGADELAAAGDRLLLVTFDPTPEATPPALAANLAWTWPVLGGAALLAAALRRRSR